jgi:Protein of unknown function (DUF2867)
MTLCMNPTEYRSRSLRVHELLKDVALEDVWEIRLAGGGAGRTIHDLRPLFSFAELQQASPVIKGLFRLRWHIGALLGWDERVPTLRPESYVHRLAPTDHDGSVVPPGTVEGPFAPFTTLYVFEHEHLSEVRNATVHAFLSLSLEPVPGGYLAYMAVYVKPVNRFTRLYMNAIAPFRRLLVYPAMIRKVQRAWAERYGNV